MKRIEFFKAIGVAIVTPNVLSSCGKNKDLPLSAGGSVLIGGEQIFESVDLWLSGSFGTIRYSYPGNGSYGGSYVGWFEQYKIYDSIFYVQGPPTSTLSVPLFDRWGNSAGEALCKDVPIYYPNTNVIKYQGMFTQLQQRDYGKLGRAPVRVMFGGHPTSNDGKVTGEIIG